MEDCSDKVVAVTGYARGIGSALSEAFAQTNEASGLYGRLPEKSVVGLVKSSLQEALYAAGGGSGVSAFCAASGLTTLPALVLPSTMA